MTTLNFTATQAEASKYDPTLRRINRPQDTVAGQMEGLLSKDNDYMKRAETRANHQMNSRGLLNSSMAVGASQAAAIDAALPIAQQDASTYFQQGRDNQNYTNQAAQWNAGTKTQVSLANADSANRFKLADQGYQHNRGLQEQQFGFQTKLSDQQFGHQTQLADQQYQHNRGLASLDGDIRARLMDQEARIKTQLEKLNHTHNVELDKLRLDKSEVMNKDRNAAEIYMHGLQAIGTALSNPSMNRQQQEAMISAVTGNMRAGIEFVGAVTGGSLPGSGAVPHYDPAKPGTPGNKVPAPAPAPTVSPAQKRQSRADAYRKQMARRSQNQR